MNDDLNNLSDKVSSNSEGSILARLWRKILKDRGLLLKVPHMIDMYVLRSKILAASNAITGVRLKTKSTIAANAASEDQTFKVHLDLIFNVLQAEEIVLTETIIKDGKESHHSIRIPNPNYHVGQVDERNTKENR